MLQFVGQRDHAVTLAERNAEQARQRGHHPDGFILPSGFGHPDDGVQRIIQEMRVDLRLKHFQFAAPLLSFLLYDILH